MARSRDTASAHHIHHGAVCEQRAVSLPDPGIDAFQVVCGSLPCRVIREKQDALDPFQERKPVSSRIGEIAVLDTGAVLIEAVAVRDEPGHRAKRVDRGSDPVLRIADGAPKRRHK